MTNKKANLKKAQNFKLLYMPFAILTAPGRLFIHQHIAPRVAGVSQKSIADALQSSAPEVPNIDLADPQIAKKINDALIGILASYHTTASQISECRGELIHKVGDVDHFGKAELTHTNIAEYDPQREMIADFWDRYDLIEAVQLDPDQARLKGLSNLETFSALVVQEKDNPENVSVIGPGANRDGISGNDDLKRGFDVTFGCTNGNCGIFAALLKDVEKKTGYRPTVVTYSNSSPLGLTAAIADYESFSFESVGLNPPNICAIMHDAKKYFGVDVSAKEAIGRVNRNTVALRCPLNTNVYGYGLLPTNTFLFKSDNKELNDVVAKENVIVHSSPLSLLHQIAYTIADILKGNGKFYRVEKVSKTVLGILRENADFRGDLIPGTNPDSPVQMSANGQNYFIARTSYKYPVDRLKVGLQSIKDRVLNTTGKTNNNNRGTPAL